MKNIQITTIPTVNGTAKSICIILEGELLLRHLHELTAEVKGIINQYENITIELKNIINIDLACIQMLLAAKQTAAAEKKNIICQIELPTEVKNLLKHAGLVDLPAMLN